MGRDPYAIGGFANFNDGVNGYFDGLSWYANVNLANGTSHVVPTTDPGAAVSVLNLRDLNDVEFSSLASSDILSYNGQTWVNVPSAGNPSITFLNDLLDVDTANLTPVDGQVLKWNNSTLKFERADGTFEVSADLSPSLGGPLETGIYRIFNDPSGLRLTQTTVAITFAYGATANQPVRLILNSTGNLGTVTLASHGGDPNNQGVPNSYTVSYYGPVNLGDVLTYQETELTSTAPRWLSGARFNAPYVPTFSSLTPGNGATWVYNSSSGEWEPAWPAELPVLTS